MKESLNLYLSRTNCDLRQKPLTNMKSLKKMAGEKAASDLDLDTHFVLQHGLAPLHAAAKGGHSTTIRTLKDAGALLDATDNVSNQKQSTHERKYQF